MNLFVLFLIRLFGASENETSHAFNFDAHLVLNLPVPNVHQNFGFTPLHVCATIMYTLWWSFIEEPSLETSGFSLYFSGSCIPINPELSYYCHYLVPALAKTV